MNRTDARRFVCGQAALILAGASLEPPAEGRSTVQRAIDRAHVEQMLAELRAELERRATHRPHRSLAALPAPVPLA